MPVFTVEALLRIDGQEGMRRGYLEEQRVEQICADEQLEFIMPLEKYKSNKKGAKTRESDGSQ